MTLTNISFKRIQQLAIPAIIAGIAEPVLSSTDAAVVGNIPEFGTESLAAVGIVGAFLSALIWILGQTRSAISAIISQNLGAGTMEDLKSFPAQAVYFNIGLSIMLLLATYFFVEEIFTLLNAKGMILDLSVAYYDIRVWGFPLTLFTFAIFGIFRGLQNTFWPMIVAAIGAGVNVGLDFLFVYGLEGYVDAMGVVGAAWASLIAQGIMAVLSLVLVLKKTNVSLRLTFPLHPEINRLVAMSANLFLRSVALNVALILSTRSAAGLGTPIVAAHTIALNLWLFTAFFLDGYGAAGNILGGKLLGENNFNSLWQLTKKVVLYNTIVAAILVVLGLVFYDTLGWIYNKDAQVLDIYASVFYMVLLCIPFSAVAFTLDAIFKGLGEMGYLRNVLLASTFFGFVPVLLLSQYLGWGLWGIWLAIIVWVFWRGVALVIKYYKKYLPLAKR